MFRICNNIIDFNVGFKEGFENEVRILKKFLYRESLIFLMPIVEWPEYPLTSMQKRYIENNLYISNKEIIFDTPEDIIEELKNCKIHWIQPRNDKEIQELLEDSPYMYSWCIIQNGEYNLHEYEMLLHIEENYNYEGKEYRALIIKEKNEGNFEKIIFPKILKAI